MKFLLPLFITMNVFSIFSQEKIEYKFDKSQVYKDSLPYSGDFYIKGNNTTYQIYHYFEKGKLKWQFSKDPTDLLKLKEAKRITSSFKDGKIFDGFEFYLFDKCSTIKKLKNGVLEYFMFEMGIGYYGNRFTFIKNLESIEIKDLMNIDYKIEIKLENNIPIAKIIYRDKIIISPKLVEFNVNNLPKNNRLILLDISAEKKCYASSTLEEDKIDPKSILDDDIFLGIFPFLENKNSSSIDSEYLRLAECFSNKELLFNIFDKSDKEKEESILIEGEIYTDKNGKIEEGIIFYNKKSFYEIYKKGNVVKKGPIDLSKFQKLYSDYLNNRIKY